MRGKEAWVLSSPIRCHFKLYDPEHMTPLSVACFLWSSVMALRPEQQFPNGSLEIWGAVRRAQKCFRGSLGGCGG